MVGGDRWDGHSQPQQSVGRPHRPISHQLAKPLRGRGVKPRRRCRGRRRGRPAPGCAGVSATQASSLARPDLNPTSPCQDFGCPCLPSAFQCPPCLPRPQPPCQDFGWPCQDFGCPCLPPAFQCPPSLPTTPHAKTSATVPHPCLTPPLRPSPQRCLGPTSTHRTRPPPAPRSSNAEEEGEVAR